MWLRKEVCLLAGGCRTSSPTSLGEEEVNLVVVDPGIISPTEPKHQDFRKWMALARDTRQ